MKKEKRKLRRSGARIMASLILLLGSLSYIMLLAVLNGSLGFICAMGVTLFGAFGVAKFAISNSTAIITSHLNCSRSCGIRYSARCACSVPRNSKANRKEALSQ